MTRPLATIAAVVLLLVAVLGLLYVAREQVAPTTTVPSSPPTAIAVSTPPIVAQTAPPPAVGTPTPASLLAGVCGSVIGGVPSDGAHMLLTLTSGGSSNTTFSVEYQFESGGGVHPLDIDGRVAGTMAWTSGRQVPADPGAPAGAIALRDWTLRRAMSCTPLSIVDPIPSLFTLPQGCAFVGSPVSTADQTDWKVDCGAAANRNARGTLGPAFAAQAWTSCGSGLATATWVNSRFLLVVSESSGAAGDYPKLTQRLRTTSACP
jgi:hypothetical protein